MSTPIIAATAALLWLTLGSGHAGQLQVWDDRGRAISMSQPAQRIVTLSPHLTQLVLAVDAGQQLVGVSSADRLPSSFDQVPRMGGASGIDREALMMTAPDLVLAWLSGNRMADIAWLETLGIPVFVSEPRDLADIAQTIRAIGKLSGHDAVAERAAARFLVDSSGRCDVDSLRPVVIVIWDQPLLTIGGRHWMNAVLEAGGYRNHFADVPRGVFSLAPESHAAVMDIETISLQPDGSGSDSDRLAQAFSQPGPGLTMAIDLLCRRRMAQAP